MWCLLVFLSLSPWLVEPILVPMAARYPVPGKKASPGSPWPLPQSWTKSSLRASLAAPEKFEYVTNVKGCDVLDRAFERYNHAFLTRNKKPDVDPDLPPLTIVRVDIPEVLEMNLCLEYPRMVLDKNYEAYELEVDLDAEDMTQAAATITASTVWGALHGLETFSQLVYQDLDWSVNQFYVNFTYIEDFPRFPHRGFMVDTARHFLAPGALLEILDGMSYNKFNVFHWHIVDDQSFPFVSKKFPELSQKGAFIPGVLEYTPETVATIINEARLRGIRVILEFDTPGHTYAIGKSHQELLTPCYGDGKTPGTPNYPYHAAYENLDPFREPIYAFMREFFSDVFQNVTKDEYLHLGMDEIYYPCWQSSPVIAEAMLQYNYTSMNEVQAHYTRRHLDMIRDIGAKAIVWQDPIEHDVPVAQDVLVQVWKSPFGGHPHPWEYYMQMVLDKGYSTLLSSCWYINYLKYGQTWQEYYKCDPVGNLVNVTEEQAERILGGEAAIWGEYVDSTNIIARIFPYIGAVAEKLWSAMGSSTVEDAAWRLDEHRCRFIGRGIKAQPLMTSYCFPEEIQYSYTRTGSDGK